MFSRPVIRSRRGQALILAVLILFILVLLAAFFIAVLVQNMRGRGRQSDIEDARQLAEAGIQYANWQLTYSAEGADWRPPFPRSYLDPAASPNEFMPFGPDDPLDNTAGQGPYYYDPFERVQGWHLPDPVTGVGYTKYPDPLRPASGTLITIPRGGHVLVKVEYAPRAEDPNSKYLKITSIGRAPRDPSVWEMAVAYKPIGITDYLRFATNKDRKPGRERLGIPPNINYLNEHNPPVTGSPICRPGWAHAAILNGPVRIQNDLLLTGTGVDLSGTGAGPWQPSVEFWLRNYLPPILPPPPLNLTPYRRDRLEVTGNILLDRETSPSGAALGNLARAGVLEGTPPAIPPLRAWAVADPAGVESVLPDQTPLANGLSDTMVPPWNLIATPSGEVVVRDNRNEDDPTTDRSRRIPRLEPPALFEKDPVTGRMRWEQVTEFSGTMVSDPRNPGQMVNNGEFGYGAGYYLVPDRRRSGPAEASQVDFGDDLGKWRADFLRQTIRDTVNNWRGFGAADLRGPEARRQTVYEPPAVRIILHDPTRPVDPVPGWVANQDADVVTFNAALPTPWGVELVHLDEASTFRDPLGNDLTVSAQMTQAGRGPESLYLKYPRNGVIYCPGNVRIHGHLPAGQTLTVVSGGNIFIDGMLDNSPGSGLALLAKNYVTLNLTGVRLEVRAAPSRYISNVHPVDEPGFQGWLEVGPDGVWTAEFMVDSALAGQPIFLVLPHTGKSPGPTTMHMDVNGRPFDFDTVTAGVQNTFSFFPAPPAAVPPTQSNVLSPQYIVDAGPGQPLWELNMAGYLVPGRVNTVQFRVDTTSAPWWFSAAALTFDVRPVIPLDHVLCYAERGSWFVIPGDFKNPEATFDQRPDQPPDDPDPTVAAAIRMDRAIRERRFNYRVYLRGAIVENHTADSAAVYDWTDKWSYPAWLSRTVWQRWAPVFGQAPDAWGTIEYGYDDGLINQRRVLDRDIDGDGLIRGQLGELLLRGEDTNGDRVADAPANVMGRPVATVVLPALPRLPVSPTLLREGKQ